MSAVAVAKLKLGCEAQQRDRLLFAIEDGLRTTLPDERRLVLLRRMRIAGSLASPGQREASVRSGWLDAVAGACHGSADGAAVANCVWFESRDEAEALLAARLLAGRPVDAWFWRLAIPSWDGLPLRAWLNRCLGEALAANDDRRVLAVAGACILAGAADRLVEALAESSPDLPILPFPDRKGFVPTIGRTPFVSPTRHEREPRVSDWLPRMPPRLREAAASLARAEGSAPVAARAILRAWILRRSPALALAPEQLAAITTEAMEQLAALGPTALARAGPAETPGPLPPAGAEGPRRSEAMPSPRRADRCDEAPRPSPSGTPAPPPEATIAPSPFAGSPAAERPALCRFRRSDHAGLWLVLPGLIRLGFREWLAARPDLLDGHPASLLLHAIARHHRVAAEDPALLALPPPGEAPLPEWTGLWRHGLDRWLRRTARRRLHDLVARAGELDWNEERVEIRFPGSAVDMRLRRRALDRDPGWTDWLGLSVRYHFGGEVGWL
jgi:hypothetical protein